MHDLIARNRVREYREGELMRHVHGGDVTLPPELLSRDPELEAGEHAVRLLAPLDPLIYDRTLTARLWSFDYTWEAFTPPSKRVRGYYAMPVLAGTL